MERIKTHQFFLNNGISNVFCTLLPSLMCGEFLQENGVPSNEKLNKETKGDNRGET